MPEPLKKEIDPDSHVDQRRPFYEGPPIRKDLWVSCYKRDYVDGVKPLRKSKADTMGYLSPYSQFRGLPKEDLLTEQQKEERMALQRLAVTKREGIKELTLGSIPKEDPKGTGREDQTPCESRAETTTSTSWHHQFQQQLQRQRQAYQQMWSGSQWDADVGAKPAGVNNLTLPTIAQPRPPPDAMKPPPCNTQAKEWKGVPLPIVDPRFEPLVPSDQDSDYMILTTQPFRYFNRKKKFPELYKCANVPVPKELYGYQDLLGNWQCIAESKLTSRAWPKKRYPRPPESFITRLW